MTPAAPALHARWNERLTGPEPVASALLALGHGLYLLWLLVSLHRPGGVAEAEEFRIFALGWALVPALALASAVAVHRSLAAREGDAGERLWRLAFANAAALALGAAVLRATSLHLGVQIAASLAIPAVSLAVLLREPGRRRVPAAWLPAGTVILWTLLLLVASASASSGAPSPASVGAIAAGAAALALSRRAAPRGGWRRLADALAVGLLVVLVVDPRLPFDTYHYNAFLGAANAVAHGRIPLVDTATPYGILSIDFLAAYFRLVPMTYVGLALLVTALLVLRYACVYLLLRFLLPSVAVAIGCLAVVVALSVGSSPSPLTYFPSAGPLRFGIPWLFPLLVVLRTRLPRATRATRVAEGLLLGLASLWEVQTLLASLAAWGGVLLAETFFASRSEARALRGAVLRGAGALLCIVGAHAAFALRVRAAAGVWPDWSLFADYVMAVTPAGEGFGLHPAPGWGGWIVVASVYLGSLLACVHAAPRAPAGRAAARLTVVFAVTLMGVAQLSYYVPWSIAGRLVHVSVPATLVAAFWWAQLVRPGAGLRPGLPAAVAASAAVALLALAGQHQERIAAFLGRSSLAALPGALGGEAVDPPRGCPSLRACLLERHAVHPTAGAALELMQRHAPDAERAGVFLNAHATTEAAFLSGRPHAFPVTDAFVDNTSAAAAGRIARADHGLRAGDVIFVDRKGLARRSPSGIDGNHLLKRLLQRLCTEFDCILEDRKGTVLVQRLVARD